jgi:hypothetical protein
VGRRTFYHVKEDHPLKYPVSPYDLTKPPQLTVRALRVENLATHAEHLIAQERPNEAASSREKENGTIS